MADLTQDEKTLFSRVAIHMANGMTMEHAIQAVRDDDFRIACAFGVFRPALQRRTPEQQECVSMVAQEFWKTLRSEDAAP